MRRTAKEGSRHQVGIPYLNAEMASIISNVENETGDRALAQSIFFSPTALTHIKRLIEFGGSIITDTPLIAQDINTSLLGTNGAKVLCYVDDPQVKELAMQRRITRAEVAIDYSLAVPGPKLLVVGVAPTAINRLLFRRQHEPMADVCVFAASTGFASVVQLKEKLIDSDIASVVIRGKKGGVPASITLLNAILGEIAKGYDTPVV